jgi:hypothetical protein
VSEVALLEAVAADHATAAQQLPIRLDAAGPIAQVWLVLAAGCVRRELRQAQLLQAPELEPLALHAHLVEQRGERAMRLTIRHELASIPVIIIEMTGISNIAHT